MKRLALLLLLFAPSVAQAQLVPVDLVGCPGGMCPINGGQFNPGRYSQPFQQPEIQSISRGVATPLADYHAAVLRVGRLNPDDPQMGASFAGTGTLVASNGKQGLVLTAAHVMDSSRGQAWVEFNGQRYSAKLVGSDPGPDVAALVVSNPPSNITPIPLAEDNEFPTAGAQVELCGYGGNRFRHFAAPVKGYATRDSKQSDQIVTDFTSISGDSGGPILYRGKVCGLLWGGPTQGPNGPIYETHGAACMRIRSFLQRIDIHLRPRKYGAQLPGGNTPGSSAPGQQPGQGPVNPPAQQPPGAAPFVDVAPGVPVPPNNLSPPAAEVPIASNPPLDAIHARILAVEKSIAEHPALLSKLRDDMNAQLATIKTDVAGHTPKLAAIEQSLADLTAKIKSQGLPLVEGVAPIAADVAAKAPGFIAGVASYWAPIAPFIMPALSAATAIGVPGVGIPGALYGAYRLFKAFKNRKAGALPLPKLTLPGAMGNAAVGASTAAAQPLTPDMLTRLARIEQALTQQNNQPANGQGGAAPAAGTFSSGASNANTDNGISGDRSAATALELQQLAMRNGDRNSVLDATTGFAHDTEIESRLAGRTGPVAVDLREFKDAVRTRVDAIMPIVLRKSA